MYQTSTPCPAPEPGEYLSFLDFANLTGMSVFTIRTQWKDYEMPFEQIGGRTLCSRSAAEQWIANRTRQAAAKMTDFQAELMWQAMNERRAAMGRK